MYSKVKYKVPIKIATIITEIINIVANAIKLFIKISNYYSSFISIFAPQYEDNHHKCKPLLRNSLCNNCPRNLCTHSNNRSQNRPYCSSKDPISAQLRGIPITPQHQCSNGHEEQELCFLHSSLMIDIALLSCSFFFSSML